MRKSLLPLALALSTLAGAPAVQAAPQTDTFGTAGEYAFTVPAGVTSIRAVAVGGSGGNNDLTASGGQGGRVVADIAVQGGQVVFLEVGGNGRDAGPLGGGNGDGGFNGGGGGGGGGGANALGGGGGGASDIRTAVRTAPQTLSSRILVAAGGGGAAGAAGGPAGAAGTSGSTCSGSGGGPGQSGGDAGGGCNGGGNGQAGAAGQGGGGGGTGGGVTTGGGGGGGGGFGGGGGGHDAAGQSGGGGGGSPLFGPNVVFVSSDVPGAVSPPSISLTYERPAAGVTSTGTTFATTAQGTVSGSQTFTVTNTGGGLLAVGGETFAANGGSAGADDFFVGSSNCGAPLASGASCEIKVRFAPQGQGARGAVMHILTNAPGSPSDVTLSGTGGPLPKGDKGDPGPKGDPCPATDPVCKGPKGDKGNKGDKGPKGPPGRDALISCKVVKTNKTKEIKVICTVRFLSSRASKVRARLSRGNRVVAAAQGRARNGRVSLRMMGWGEVRAGRYTLTLVTRDGHGGSRTTRVNVQVG